MEESVKDIMARMLAEWLLKDFGLLLDEPSSKEIEATLEKYEENLGEKR
tara:strand:- start:33 stop:179 length:147 start_codon:yes stop_codon:yes gene_type:complete